MKLILFQSCLPFFFYRYKQEFSSLSLFLHQGNFWTSARDAKAATTQNSKNIFVIILNKKYKYSILIWI